MNVNFLDAALLDRLSEQARQAPRRRAHHNLHTDLAAPAQRVIVAIEPGSFVRPHLHADPAKAETFIVLRGRLGVVTFHPEGTVSGHRVLTAGGDCWGHDMPVGCLHTVLALEPGSVFLETKAGPYAPLTADEIPVWSPEEGSAAAEACLRDWTALFTPA